MIPNANLQALLDRARSKAKTLTDAQCLIDELVSEIDPTRPTGAPSTPSLPTQPLTGALDAVLKLAQVEPKSIEAARSQFSAIANSLQRLRTMAPVATAPVATARAAVVAKQDGDILARYNALTGRDRREFFAKYSQDIWEAHHAQQKKR